MLRPQLLGLARWMQGIGREQEPIDQSRRFRRQHAALPAAVGMSTEPNLIGMFLANLQDFGAQAFAIARGVTGTRRPHCTILSKRQIVTDHLNPVFRKRVVESDQQRRIAIRSSAVSEK